LQCGEQKKCVVPSKAARGARAGSTFIPHTGSLAPRRTVSQNSAAKTAVAITFRTSL
jgi:hypothetical protein